MSFIEYQNVSFEYPGGFKAVENINLNIEEGDCVAIIGQNGAGKTTTVKLLNGLNKPTEGDVVVDGMNTKDYTIAQLSCHVGYVFQNPDDQIFHNTVGEEVSFGIRHLNLPDEKRGKLIEDALDLTGLTGDTEENPFNMPLSVRKFISIASILAMDPKVVVFDEPTAGQDLVGNERLSNIIRVLKQRRKTIIIISHDMEFVANNFQKVIVMANKHVLKVGAPDEIFWDFHTLDEAMLKQPYVAQIMRRVNVGGYDITIDAAVDRLTDIYRGRRNN